MRKAFLFSIVIGLSLCWGMALGQSVVSTSPTPNALGVPVNTNIGVTFDVAMDPSTINDTSFLVSGFSTGPRQGSISYDATRTSPAKSVGDFVTPDGRFDLEAARRSGYQGPLDLEGVNVRLDPTTGEPIIQPSAAKTPTDDPDDVYWDSTLSLSIPGVSGQVYALTVYDNKLIVGGDFEVAGGVCANNIASWNGSYWSALGSGMNDAVWALAVYDSMLIAGGAFTAAGGVSADYVAAWDDSSWSPLGAGMGGEGFPEVFALAVYDSKLIAGGGFTTAGGVGANYIAAWDGSFWSQLGLGTNGWIRCLAVYDGTLIAGGGFTTAGGVSAENIASWEGSTWLPLGSGINGPVLALTIYNNALISGGLFSTAGDSSASYIAS